MKSLTGADNYSTLEHHGASFSMTISYKTNELFICNCDSKTIEVHKINAKNEIELIKTISLEQWLKFPLSININYY